MPGPTPNHPASRLTAAPDLPLVRSAAGPRFPAMPQLRHWLVIGILLSAAVIALGMTVQLAPGETSAELGVDQELSRHHLFTLTAVAMTINLVFGPVVGLALVGVVALYVWLVRRNLVKAVAFGLAACSGWVASEAFKLLIARQRPNPALLLDPLAPETGSNSFPSGHTAFAVALAFALYFLARGTRWSRITAIAGAAMALLVAWSRLYVGVHYPTDVAASFLAAGAAVILLAGLWNRYAPRLAERLPASLLQPARRR